MGLSGFGHPEWDHHLKGNLDVVCFFNTDNLSERFCDFPEMPKVDYLAGGVEEGWWGGGGVVEWRGWAEGFGAKPVKSTLERHLLWELGHSTRNGFLALRSQANLLPDNPNYNLRQI